MKKLLTAAAIGLTTSLALSVAMPAAPAFAQAATPTISPAERALEAQFVALAQAGNTAGIQQLIQRQVTAGNAGMLARIARRVAQSGLTLAGTDSSSAAALAKAAVLIASDSSVIAADRLVANDVGSTVGQTVTAMTSTSPSDASDVQVAVAMSSSSDLQIGYVNGQSMQQFSGGGGGGGGGGPQFTGSTTRTTTVRRVTRPTVTRPTYTDTVTVPIVPEPNPNQLTGSPT